MDICTHVYSSTILAGTLLAVTHSPYMAISSFLAGIFIDIDHLFDFMFFARDRISLRNLITWCDDGKWERITLVFHSYELFLILWIFAYYSLDNIIIGILFGMGVHLIFDQIGNRYINKKFRLTLFFYFLTYRFFVKFHKSRLRFDRSW